MMMLDYAAQDPRVLAEQVGLDFSQDMDDQFGSWKLQLRLSPRSGKLIDDIGNWDLIRENDPIFQLLTYNELTMAIEASADLPWRPLTQGGNTFANSDRAALNHYLEREYHLRPSRSFVDELIDIAARSRFFNPVRDYLEELVWDGTPRVETALPGVRPTEYTRLVARKVLTAAVARMLQPGIKWDHTLVLFGDEGLGKTWWIDRMFKGHMATLGRIDNKDTLITMQRSWVMVADEGHSLRKADADEQKEFLTRTEDVFRLPYEREAQAHKRHCVIWSTTNDDIFLRRQIGNRRFLIVTCEDKVDFTKLTDEYVNQVWAEAVHLFRSGERLYLADEEGEAAAAEREHFTEEDALGGVLAEFLDTKVPANWETKSAADRAQWIEDRRSGFVPEGEVRQITTCSAQLWVEALGRRFGDHKRTDLLEITAAMKRLPEWKTLRGRRRIPGYGPQMVFVRTTDEDGEDLI
jgi:predicted P-loop ATPase